MVRIYGTKERREWLKAKPCVVCVMLMPVLEHSDHQWHSEICHVRTGGMGRKDDASRTVPMCRKHHVWYDEHRGFLAEPKVRALISDAAAAYDAAWISIQGEGA